MSEYQYYEFQALDRRLSHDEMATLRAFSSRARITATSFVNDYQYGSFKGNVDAWMETYFDAFLYFANWGSHELKLRIPARLLDRKIAAAYCAGDSASVQQRNGQTILTFASEDEEPDDEWDDQTDALASLIPIRAQLLQGDLRSLYIGWLRCAQAGELDDDGVEPPIPPGLKDLDGSLERLVDFLGVDLDLLEAAAAASAPLFVQTLTREKIQQWIAARPPAEKDDYLERFIAAEEPALATELRRAIADQDTTITKSPPPRTVGSLLRAAESAGEERRRAETAKAEAEKARREQEAALKRSKHLADLAAREPAAWKEVQSLIATKQTASYDRAVALLVDLRDAARAHGGEPNFDRQLDTLQTEHARKPSLLEKLRRAGLRVP